MKIKFSWTFLKSLIHWIDKIYHTFFEKSRKCLLGETDCSVCPYRNACQFHMFENI